MAPTVPTDIPDQLTAGETWKVRLSYGDFPAGDGWALAVHFRGIGTLDATTGTDGRIVADGDDFLLTVAAADTALTAGTYEWLARATLNGETYPADSGSVQILPDLASAGAGDRQSHEERMIPILETAIRTRVAADLSSYTILGRTATKEELHEYRVMLAEARSVVARQRNGGWLPSVEVHFGRP